MLLMSATSFMNVAFAEPFLEAWQTLSYTNGATVERDTDQLETQRFVSDPYRKPHHLCTFK